LTRSRPRKLLTNRARTAVALVLTTLVLGIGIRAGVHVDHKSAWLFPWHGWPMIAINVCFYAYLCWLAFWFIRGTEGLERFFIVGWFVEILASPVGVLRPQWKIAINYVGLLAMAGAFVAALCLLLTPSDVAEPDSKARPA
jgi:hypothetical protein